MSEQHINGGEPVLAIKVTKIIWLLVFATGFLAWVVLGFSDHVEKIIVDRAEKLYEIIDHEMDDANDNYEESLQLILQDKCEEAIVKYKKIACAIEIKKHEYHDSPRI